jgi:Zn-dependent peptidase ImmA (M78 family)
MEKVEINKRVDQLIHEYGIEYPINLECLCSALDVNLHLDLALNTDGYFIRENCTKHIFVSSCIENVNQKRFIIAHELGHMFLHYSQLYTNCRSIKEIIPHQKSNTGIEYEANCFAGELLVPSSILWRELQKKEIDFDLVSKIASTFCASMTATAIRCVENSSSQSELLICYRNGQKLWWTSGNPSWTNAEIPEISPERSAYDHCIHADAKRAAHVRSNGIWEQFEGVVDESVVFVTSDVALVLLSGIQKD